MVRVRGVAVRGPLLPVTTTTTSAATVGPEWARHVAVEDVRHFIDVLAAAGELIRGEQS